MTSEEAPITRGSKVLLVYPEGDCDWVKVLEMDTDQVTVKLPNGKQVTTVIEDIGIGVDEDLRVDWASFEVNEPEWYTRMVERVSAQEV